MIATGETVSAAHLWLGCDRAGIDAVSIEPREIGLTVTGPADDASPTGVDLARLRAIQAPFDAWLTLQGLKTLPLRMKEHSRVALEVANAIEGHAALTRVIYPGLDSFEQSQLARTQHSCGGGGGGHGGIVTIELKGGSAAATRFVQALRFTTLAESLGGVESLATHPETMTHSDVPIEQRAKLGITGGLVRLSIGLEDPADLIHDITSALDAVIASDTSNACSCSNAKAVAHVG